MLIEELSKEVLNKAENIRTISEAKEVIAAMMKHILEVEQELNKILLNLTSDNVSEIDFGKTKYKNYKKTILKKYVDEETFQEFVNHCEKTYATKEEG